MIFQTEDRFGRWKNVSAFWGMWPCLQTLFLLWEYGTIQMCIRDRYNEEEGEVLFARKTVFRVLSSSIKDEIIVYEMEEKKPARRLSQ